MPSESYGSAAPARRPGDRLAGCGSGRSATPTGFPPARSSASTSA